MLRVLNVCGGWMPDPCRTNPLCQTKFRFLPCPELVLLVFEISLWQFLRPVPKHLLVRRDRAHQLRVHRILRKFTPPRMIHQLVVVYENFSVWLNRGMRPDIRASVCHGIGINWSFDVQLLLLTLRAKLRHVQPVHGVF